MRSKSCPLKGVPVRSSCRHVISACHEEAPPKAAGAVCGSSAFTELRSPLHCTHLQPATPERPSQCGQAPPFAYLLGASFPCLRPPLPPKGKGCPRHGFIFNQALAFLLYASSGTRCWAYIYKFGPFAASFFVDCIFELARLLGVEEGRGMVRKRAEACWRMLTDPQRATISDIDAVFFEDKDRYYDDIRTAENNSCPFGTAPRPDMPEHVLDLDTF